MTKLYAQEKRVFDINKVTVVGSPTITSDGVASGLQANNYLKTPLFNLAELTEIEFDYDITTKEQIGSAYLCGLVGNALSLYIAKTGYMQLFFGNIYSTAIIPSTAYNVGKLHFRFVINPISLKAFVYVFQNGNKIGEIDIAISSSILTTKSFIFGADYSGNYGYALNGSIDLKSIKVVQEGTVYSPTKPTYYLERRKEGFDLSKFTVVGSPTITEDGVASGFSRGNYVQTLTSLPTSKDFTLKIKGHLNELPSGYVIGGTYNPNNDIVPLVIEFGTGANNQRVTLYVDDNGTNKLVSLWLKTPIYSVGDDFYIEVYRDKALNVYGARFYRNGIFVEELTKTEELDLAFETNLVFGIYKTNYAGIPFKGSIDLKQFSITVDGKEIFTGAKEKFYAMQGGI